MKRYEPMLITCDWSGTSMQEAARRLGPAFVYDLHIHPQQILHVIQSLKAMLCLHIDNPLSPYVNVIEEITYQPYEWCLAANGKAVGSRGT